MNILFAKSFIDRFHNYESIVVILTIFIVVILTIFITRVSQYLNNTSISVQTTKRLGRGLGSSRSISKSIVLVV